MKHIEGTLAFTQTQMTTDAVQALEAAEEEIAGLLTLIREIPGINLQLLEESQAAWEEFSERDATLFASFAEGGSLHPMRTAEWRLALAEERAEKGLVGSPILTGLSGVMNLPSLLTSIAQRIPRNSFAISLDCPSHAFQAAFRILPS
ncbi:lysozyme inhibitor LprI family protein [Rhizobium leguminosarum]|uniref:lysozyme inhibitor LprI family protein n=1 Tax=Rhizobium leguminosarum TaxID=384 RepID=UPI001F3EE742|nr:lysozyme inhibitor LprI family protein [Rhizobium leguminosarum]UIK19395.1 lysozyme inhibitor LprI family protein [Rhizobium leguminosarum]